MKHEWRKAEKTIYLPKAQPEISMIPTYKYITLHGEGDPNQSDFQRRAKE